VIVGAVGRERARQIAYQSYNNPVEDSILGGKT
jgi:hypothetical protein